MIHYGNWLQFVSRVRLWLAGWLHARSFSSVSTKDTTRVPLRSSLQVRQRTFSNSRHFVRIGSILNKIKDFCFCCFDSQREHFTF